MEGNQFSAQGYRSRITTKLILENDTLEFTNLKENLFMDTIICFSSSRTNKKIILSECLVRRSYVRRTILLGFCGLVFENINRGEGEEEETESWP